MIEIEDLPDQWTFSWHIMFCIMCDDIAFSISHTLLHTRFLMRNVHYVHHRHKITVGLAATYAHPLEYMFGNVLTAASGVLILGRSMHFWTFMMYLAWIQMNTINGHCGYDFPWSPFSIFPL